MRRVAWFLLAVLCTSFVEVQPFELLNSCHCVCCQCCHCKVPGACGMPCCGAPAPACQTLAAEETAGIRGVALRPAAQPRQLSCVLFVARGAELAEASCALAPSAFATPAARVPLFKAHCSFLI
jgi:hypothetical protein